MTERQACKLIGVSAHDSPYEIERAYVARLRELHLWMVPGQPLAVRERAEQEIARLKVAFELLKNKPAGGQGPNQAHGHGAAQPKPVGGLPKQQGSRPAPAPFAAVLPLSNRALCLSFLIAVLMMLAVFVLCGDVASGTKTKRQAKLRVRSAPWCNVEVDGKKLGPSGQIAPFELMPGEHQITLHKDNRVLRRTIRLYEGRETLLEVQFEKGQIDVSEK